MTNEHKWNRFGKASAWLLGVGTALGIVYGIGRAIYNEGYSATELEIKRDGIGEYYPEYKNKQIPNNFPLQYEFTEKNGALDSEVLFDKGSGLEIVIKRGNIKINHKDIVFGITPENKVTVQKQGGDKYVHLCEGNN